METKIMMLNFDDTSFALPNMSQLPVDKSPERTNDEKISKSSADGKSFVLIFGIDREIRVLLRTILEIWNYNSAEAETVEEALRLASQKSIDLVLMDTKLMFPDSLVEMRAMRKFISFKDSPFILLSGHIQNDIRLMALGAGAAEYFVKPINLDLLEETIKLRINESNRIKQGL